MQLPISPIIRILSFKDTNHNIILLRPIIIFFNSNNYLNPYLKNKEIYKVDLDTGRIEGEILNLAKTCNKLEDFNIPFWTNLKELAKEMHKKLNSLNLIGWDFIISNQGPVVLEGNTNPWLTVHQLDPYDSFYKDPIFELILHPLKIKAHLSKIR